MTDLHDRRVLVTGGAGFIGSHLVDALIAQGARVRVLDDLSTGRRGNLAAAEGRFEMAVGDIRDLAVCREACEEAELVFHQAALGSVPRSLENPATTIGVNVQGTANVLEAARRGGARRVVYASSSSVYGDSERLPKREGEEGRPLSPYAASKCMTEQLASVFARSFGLEVVGLRYFNVFGPRQSPEGPYAAVVPAFFREAAAGRPMRIHGDGRQTRDFTYVGDAVRANLLAAAAPAERVAGGVFNVAGGQSVAIAQLAEAIRDLTGSGAGAVHGPERPGDVRHSLADLARAGRELAYEPRVPLREGLAACLRELATDGAPAPG